MAKLDDKVAVITGRNSGIGFETARRLGPMGVAVVIGCLEDAREAGEKLRAEGNEDVRDVRLDITRPEDRREIARHLEDRYGQLPCTACGPSVKARTRFAPPTNAPSQDRPAPPNGSHRGLDDRLPLVGGEEPDQPVDLAVEPRRVVLLLAAHLDTCFHADRLRIPREVPDARPAGRPRRPTMPASPRPDLGQRRLDHDHES
jgi:hypothetical protein